MTTLALHYERLVYLNTKVKKKHGGSTFDIEESTGKLIKNVRPRKKEAKQNVETKYVEEKSFDFPDWYKISMIENQIESSITDDNPEKEKKPHKLNKKKVREKLTAYFHLKQSKKFLAFYSISFPVNTPDDICYQIFNTVLTRCRKNDHLTSYLWVSERQKNQTAHFHLVTNSYMSVRKVNNYVKQSLITFQKRGLENLKEVDLSKYNGVDVRRVENNEKKLACYLTKYVSKNTIEFYRAAWNCSKSISALFTHSYYDLVKDREYVQEIQNSIKKYVTHILDFDYCTVENVHVKQPDGTYPYIQNSSIRHINTLNQVVYDNILNNAI